MAEEDVKTALGDEQDFKPENEQPAENETGKTSRKKKKEDKADDGGDADKPPKKKRRRKADDGSNPVQPLGLNGQQFYYIDTNNQLVSLKAGEHGKLHIQALYAGRFDFLWDQYPRYNKEGEQTGWAADQASEELMTGCAGAGIWDPMGRERGVGAWLDDDGNLVFHCGDVILINQPDGSVLWKDTGLIGRYVYPAAPAQPRPEWAARESLQDAINDLVSLLNTWNWRRPVDRILITGFIAAAMVCGALRWRPAIWITGGAGTGKSTLQELIHTILGGGVISASDATAAGLWQKLGVSTLPVAMDEFEAEEDNSKINTVIKLARQAASGGKVMRGGADHQASEFTLRSCFVFSSILVPPLTPQDRTRLAVLQLNPLEKGSAPPPTLSNRWREIGAGMRFRLQKNWHLVDGCIAEYRHALLQEGWDSRGADQFGALLGLAHLVEHCSLPDPDDAFDIVQQLAGAVDEDDTRADEYKLLDYLLQGEVDFYRNGSKRLLGEWIRRAAGGDWATNVDQSLTSDEDAQRCIGNYGLKVTNKRNDVTGQFEAWLYVANSHRGLKDYLKGSHWSAKDGSTGVWVQSIDRLPGVEKVYQPVRFGSAGVSRCRRIPLSTVFPEG